MEESIKRRDRAAPRPRAESATGSDDGRADGDGVNAILLNQRFLLLELIATGGTSYIHKARDLLSRSGVDNAELAIKVPRKLPHAKTLGADFNARIVTYEAQVARRLSHPNILRIFDFHRDGDAYFLTMEYIPGETLAAYMRRAPDHRIDYRAADTILGAVASALKAAHNEGVVHSDLKPANILLGQRGPIKLIDFASARMVRQLGMLRHQIPTDSGYLAYSPPYASLETSRELPATPSDDIYSLGCILYEMLAGRHPFDRRTALQALTARLRPQRPPGINLLQWLVLRRALNLRSRDRFQDVQRFVDAFRMARRAPLWCAALLPALLLLGSAVAWLLPEAAPTPVAMSALVQSSEALAASIRSASAEERVQRLADLRQEPEATRERVLALMREELTIGLLATLYAAEAERRSHWDLAVAKREFALLQAYYPDSSRLAEARYLLERARLHEETPPRL